MGKLNTKLKSTFIGFCFICFWCIFLYIFFVLYSISLQSIPQSSIAWGSRWNVLSIKLFRQSWVVFVIGIFADEKCLSNSQNQFINDYLTIWIDARKAKMMKIVSIKGCFCSLSLSLFFLASKCCLKAEVLATEKQRLWCHSSYCSIYSIEIFIYLWIMRILSVFCCHILSLPHESATNPVEPFNSIEKSCNIHL